MQPGTLEQVNKHRNVADWESVESEVRGALDTDANDLDALRILAQAIEKLKRDDELPDIWARMVELEEAPGATSKRLAETLQAQDDTDGAVKYFRVAIKSFLKTKNFDRIENVWLELVDLAPEPLDFFLDVLEGMVERDQGKRAGLLAQTLWTFYLEAKRWAEGLKLVNVAALHGADDSVTRQALIQCLENVHADCGELDSILASSGLRRDRPLKEGFEEVGLLLRFVEGAAFRHPDWGVGIVQRLDVIEKRITIDFQRRKGHAMDIALANRALEELDADDYRTIRIKTPARAKELVQEDPLFLGRSVIKSFGGSASARQMKERLCGDLIEPRAWNRWWSNVQTLLKNDQYVGISGGTSKTYTLRDEPATETQEWIGRLGRVRNLFGKLDVFRKYLLQVKKADRDADLLGEMTALLVMAAQKQSKPEVTVEVVMTLQDLEVACDGFAADPKDLAIEPFASELHCAMKTIQALRHADHQQRFSDAIQATQDEAWPDIFRRLLLVPGIQVRNHLADLLHEAGHHDLLAEMLRVVSTDPRQYIETYCWLADRSLRRNAKFLKLDIASGVLFERLLQLVDFLCDQAKRLDKDDAIRLRKQAARIRDILKGGHYEVFHDLLPTLDRGQAISIYRRASTNAGMDIRAREHFTSRILSRYPDLFSAEDVDTGPPRLHCLPETLRQKRELLERLATKEIPAVTREMEIAREQGDLRENAEYHAARERIRLLSTQAEELQEQLGMSEAIPLERVDPSRVAFGTRIALQAASGSDAEIFHFLGPWESDPDRNILATTAPFAIPFMGASVGERVEVELATHTGRYVVESIEAIQPNEIAALLAAPPKKSAVTNAEPVAASDGEEGA